MTCEVGLRVRERHRRCHSAWAALRKGGQGTLEETKEKHLVTALQIHQSSRAIRTSGRPPQACGRFQVPWMGM